MMVVGPLGRLRGISWVHKHVCCRHIMPRTSIAFKRISTASLRGRQRLDVIAGRLQGTMFCMPKRLRELHGKAPRQNQPAILKTKKEGITISKGSIYASSKYKAYPPTLFSGLLVP